MTTASFHLRPGGHQALLATVAIAFCFAAWCVQLGGVASLQAACPKDLGLDLNDIDPIVTFLQQQQQHRSTLLGAQQKLIQLAAVIPTLPFLHTFNQTLLITKSLYGLVNLTATILDGIPHIGESLAILTSRSASGAFTLTPGQECSSYYRYQWLNTALQLVVLLLAVYALLTNLLASARVAICCMLTLASVLAIQNAHTSFYVRQYAPDLTLAGGKAFFFGCIMTASTNLFLLLVLGIHDEATEGAGHAPTSQHLNTYHTPEPASG